MSNLPTREEMFQAAAAEMRNARASLADARDWLASDWRPAGSRLTKEQAAARTTAREAIGGARTAIDEALRQLDDAAAGAR